MAETDAPVALVGLDLDAKAVHCQLLTRGGGTVHGLVAAFGLNRTRDPRPALSAPVEPRTRQLAPCTTPPPRPVNSLTSQGGRAPAGPLAPGVASRTSGTAPTGSNRPSDRSCRELERPPYLLAPSESLDEAAIRRGVRAVHAAASFGDDGGRQDLGRLSHTARRSARCLP